MLMHALVPLVVAGSPVEDLAAVLSTPEGRQYRAAAVCSPLGPVLEPMGALLLLLGAPESAHETEDFLALGRLLDPGVAQSSGIALDGTLILGSDGGAGPGMAAVPFSGTAGQAELLLRAGGTEVARHPESGWVVTSQGDQEHRVRQVGPHLVFQRVSEPGTEPTEAMPGLLRGLPKDEGCALFLDTEEGLLDGLPPATAAAVLPSGPGRTARVRVSAQDVLPRSFSHQGAVTRAFGSSTPSPMAVLQVNVPGLDLFQVPVLSVNLGIGPQEQAALESLLFIEPGLTVALFGARDAPQLAATMGVLRPSGRAFAAAGLNRRVVRMLREMGMPVQKLGRTAFASDLNGTLVYGATDRGRLSVGTDPVVVAEALVGYGTPWVQGDFAGFAQGQPVALSVNDALVEGGLTAGLRSGDRAWDLTVQSGGAAIEVLDALVSMVSPAYVSLRERASAAAGLEAP